MNCIKSFLSLLSISFLLLSCSDDDDQVQTLSENDLQGSWTLVEMNASSGVDLNNDGTSNTDITNETDCFDNMTVDFQAENNFMLDYPGLDFDQVDGETVLNCNDNNTTGSYSLNGSTLSITTEIENTVETDDFQVNLNGNQLSFTVTNAQAASYFDFDTSDNENADLQSIEFVFEEN
ncbi:MAG: DUF5004 domain-containing protein [Psychroflexus sp.]